MKQLTWVAAIAVVVAGLAFGASRASGAQANISMVGSTTVGPLAKSFAEYYMELHKDVNITVKESGSGDGAKALVNNACDIANMSRFMRPEEVQAAVYGGVTPVAHVVAMDGLPVLVHPSNPVKGLTIDQVRDIYSGKITNWNELGGPDLKIVRFSRDTNSGTYETFKELVMGKVLIDPGTEYFNSNGAIRARVQATPAGIGYAGLGFVDRTVKALEINGVYPSKETVVSGRYPIARPLFMFTNGYPKLGSHVHALVTLYLTKKGQEIVEAIGFVPMTSY